MTLDELYKAIAEDFVIIQEDLGGEAIRTSKLWQKYTTLLSQEDTKLKMLELKKRKLIRAKAKAYSGGESPEFYKANPDIANKFYKTDAALFQAIDRDDDVITFDGQVLLQQQKVELLKNCLDECKRRGFNIKSGIEWHKFMNGH